MKKSSIILRFMLLEVAIFAIILFIVNIISIVRFLLQTIVAIGMGIWQAVITMPFIWVFCTMAVAQILLFVFYKKQKS